MSTFYNNGNPTQSNKVVISGPDSGSSETITSKSAKDPNSPSGSVVVETQDIQKVDSSLPIASQNSAPIQPTVGSYNLDINNGFKKTTNPLINDSMLNGNFCFADGKSVDVEKIGVSTSTISQPKPTISSARSSNTGSSQINFAGGNVISPGSTPGGSSSDYYQPPLGGDGQAVPMAWHSMVCPESCGDFTDPWNNPDCTKRCFYGPTTSANNNMIFCHIGGPFATEQECLNNPGGGYRFPHPPRADWYEDSAYHTLLVRKVGLQDKLSTIRYAGAPASQSIVAAVSFASYQLTPGAKIVNTGKTKQDMGNALEPVVGYSSYKYCWELPVNLDANPGVNQSGLYHFCASLFEYENNTIGLPNYNLTPAPSIVGGPYLNCGNPDVCPQGWYTDDVPPVGYTAHINHQFGNIDGFTPLADGIYVVEAQSRFASQGSKSREYDQTLWEWPDWANGKFIFIAVTDGIIRWMWEADKFSGSPTDYWYYGNYTNVNTSLCTYTGGDIVKTTTEESPIKSLLNHIIENNDPWYNYREATAGEAFILTEFPNTSTIGALEVRELMRLGGFVPNDADGNPMSTNNISATFFFNDFLNSLNLIEPVMFAFQNKAYNLDATYQTVYSVLGLSPLVDQTGWNAADITAATELQSYNLQPIGGEYLEAHCIVYDTVYSSPNVTFDHKVTYGCWPITALTEANAKKMKHAQAEKAAGKKITTGPYPAPIPAWAEPLCTNACEGIDLDKVTNPSALYALIKFCKG